MILRYRPRRAVSGSTEVGGRAGPKPGRRPPEAVQASWRIGPADEVQPSQAGAGRQQTAENSYPVAAKAVSNSQPESPEINTTNIASSSRSSPTSRPRARRSVPGFPQRVAAPAPSTLSPAEHDTTIAAAVVKSGIDWPTPAPASTEPTPALLQFPEPTLEALGSQQADQEGEKGDAKQDILSGDVDTGQQEGGEGAVAGGVMATTSSLSR